MSTTFPVDSSADRSTELDPFMSPDLQSKLQSEQDITAYNELQSESTFESRSWGDVTDELLDILLLEDDWDGMGATAPARGLVQDCFDLARTLREERKAQPPDMIRPTPDGNISFEWQTDFGHFEIEVSDDCIEFIQIDQQKEIRYRNFPIEIE